MARVGEDDDELDFCGEFGKEREGNGEFDEDTVAAGLRNSNAEVFVMWSRGDLRCSSP